MKTIMPRIKFMTVSVSRSEMIHYLTKEQGYLEDELKDMSHKELTELYETYNKD